MVMRLWAVAAMAVLAAAPAARAEDALVAVAANFAEVMERLEQDFERDTGHTLTVTTGSTGKLYAQIVHGAPFHVLLAADQQRPARLEEEGAAVSGSRFTYAVGRLTLWSADPRAIPAEGAEFLRTRAPARIALANPDLAPYGAAARQTLEALGLWQALRPRVVMGENIGQAHAMVATGNAPVGFVALSYVLSPRNPTPGSRWDVPPELYAPIRQDAVLLSRGAGNDAARSFMEYLQRPGVRQVIEGFGYGVPPAG